MTNLSSTSRVARGATYIFLQGFAGAIIGLGYFIVLAHTFSDPSEQWQLGAYALLSFILTLAPIAGTFALTSASIKYITQYLAQGNEEKARAVVARVLQICLAASVVAFVVVFLPAEMLSNLVLGTAAHALMFRLIAICVVFTIIQAVVACFLQALQKMREVAALGLTYTLIHSLLGVYLLSLGWRLYAVISGWLAGLIVACAAGLILTAKHIGLLSKPHPIRPLVSFALPLYVSNAIIFFLNWVDQLLLVSFMGFLYGSTEAQRILGIYHVAVRASTVPNLFSAAIMTVLFPKLSELYTSGGPDSLKDAFRVSTRYAVLIGFPLVIGLATLAYPSIILFAGWEYAEATQPLIIICIAALTGTLVVSVSPILMTLERTRIVSALSLVNVALSFGLSYLALAYLNLGMIGTAWGRTFAAIIILPLSLYVLTRFVQVSFDKGAILKAFAASGFMVLSIFTLDVVRRFVSSSPYRFLEIRLTYLPIYVIVGALAYCFALVALKAVKKADIRLLEEYLPRRLKRVVSWLERFASPDKKSP